MNKILIKNIYYMLAYAFTNLTRADYKKISAEEFDNLHNLFAAILSKGISDQLKHGLYLQYTNKLENLSTLHGKIEMSGTIKNFIHGRRLLTCEFDELSENNLLNQILKTTSMILTRHAEVESKYKNVLKKNILFFSNVDEINPFTIRWHDINFHRNNQNYQMLIGICKLILEGMLLTTCDGEYKLAEYIDDQKMCRLFKKFVLNFYIKECPQVKATSSKIDWILDDDNRFMLPIMQCDVMLSRGNDVLIIDTKYYSKITQKYYDVENFRSDHFYQMFAYVKNKDKFFGTTAHKVSGLLLYAQTVDDIKPNTKYSMSGNQISVKSLDLNKNFSEIVKQLKSIYAEYFL